MKRTAAALAGLAAAHALPATAPKYVFTIIVDDLGWADVGFHRNDSHPEIQTPNIDSLAAEGVELLRHYVHFTCTPSRSSFLSGRLPVHVQTTLANPEQVNSGIPQNMTAIAAKMKQAGYKTHVVGKWDAGMVTPQHTPEGRGFDSSLIYFEHKNDYWTQELMQSTCLTYTPSVVDLWDTGAPARHLNGTNYEEYIFRDRAYDIITQHDTSQPLFLLYTPHVAHCPLQIPQDWWEQFNFANDEASCYGGVDQTPYIFPGSKPSDIRCRSQYAAMISLLDHNIGNLTSQLKARGMWDDTLIILTADNGGPQAVTESGSNNWPLRGGKYSNWEGGIRAAALVSGGFLPPAVRGTKQEGIIHIADWYGTLSELAGVDPTDPVAAAAGLPAVDSVNVWPLISGQNETSPRWELPVSPTTLIQGRYKLLTGPQSEATWGGPQYPNASSPAHPIDPGPTVHCDQIGGCLFDVIADPTEHNNIASSNAGLVQSMTDRLAVLSKGFYSNNDTAFDLICPPGETMPCACWASINVWGGFFGPYAK